MLTVLRFAFRFTRVLLLLVAASSPLAGPANAANEMTRFDIDFFRGGSSEAMSQATIWVSARRVRIEQRRTGAVEKGPVLVYRGDKDLVLSISDRDRRYAQIDRRMLRMLGMKAPGAETREMRRSVDGQLKALPGDQRVALERVLGISRDDAVATPLTVEHDTDISTVAGIECTRVLMTRGEKSVGDACVASWDRIGIGEADIEVFRALANFQRDALGAKGVTPMEFVPDQAFDLIVQFDGFPLSFRRIVDDRERSAIRIRSIEHLPAEEQLFSAPADYARRAGYSAFAEHLSSSSSGPPSIAEPASASAPSLPKPTEANASPPARAAQPAASPAPPPLVPPLLNTEPRPRRRSITLFPESS